MFNFIWRPYGSLVFTICAASIHFGSIQPAFSQTSEADVLQGIDASVAARDENLTSYTVTEHYSVFRNQEKVHPAAEMTVKTTYQKDSGKSYEILNESGSELILKQVLGRVLDSEKTLTQPSNRANAIITSANYTMHVKGHEVVDGRNCIALSIAPRRSAQYLFQGDLWVDAQDYSIVQLAGVTAKSPTVLAGPTQVSRHYATIEGLPMATHATATSASWLFGQTTIDIDYTGYQMELRAAR
jgi:hypothetical protein